MKTGFLTCQLKEDKWAELKDKTSNGYSAGLMPNGLKEREGEAQE